MKRRRIELGLTQKEVALRCGVTDWTVHNRETDATKPAVRYLPRIAALLGYDPLPAPKSLGERLAARRRQLGLSRKRAANILAVDEATLFRWERDGARPSGQKAAQVEAFLTGEESVELP